MNYLFLIFVTTRWCSSGKNTYCLEHCWQHWAEIMTWLVVTIQQIHSELLYVRTV